MNSTSSIFVLYSPQWCVGCELHASESQKPSEPSWCHSLHIQELLQRLLCNLLTPPSSHQILHFKEELQSRRSVGPISALHRCHWAQAAVLLANAEVGRASGLHLRQVPWKYQTAAMQKITRGRQLPWIQRGHGRAMSGCHGALGWWTVWDIRILYVWTCD